MTSSTETDRIERSIELAAPRMRVWQALADADEFGRWFGVKFINQAFVAGQRTRGQVTYPGYEHIWFDVAVDRVEPPQRLSWHWHPYPHDAAVDYSQEEPTLVTFTLEELPGQRTRLTVIESGFDKIPAHRRVEAFRMNSGGWEAQMGNIARHVEG